MQLLYQSNTEFKYLLLFKVTEKPDNNKKRATNRT